MKHPDTNDLLAKALRGELKQREREVFERQLQAEMGLRQTFEEEKALEKLLSGVLDVPVASNFTSLVLQRLERETREEPTPTTPGIFRWFRFAFARVAAGLVAVSVIGLTVVHQYHKSQQAEMAENVRSFTKTASAIPSGQTPMQLFQDFETIQRLPPPARSDLDLELLVALQK